MAVITEAISQRNFELVGTAIGQILTLELANQKLLQSLPENHTVFKERIVAVDPKSEDVVIIVLLDSVSSNYAAQSSGQRTVNYFIDVYASGKASNDGDGDLNSSNKLLRYVGLCDYILQSHKNITLGFTTVTGVPVIAGKNVQNIQVYEQQNTADTKFSRMCRINFSVRIVESQDLWDGVMVDDNLTKVKLHLTDKGYQFKLKE